MVAAQGTDTSDLYLDNSPGLQRDATVARRVQAVKGCKIAADSFLSVNFDSLEFNDDLKSYCKIAMLSPVGGSFNAEVEQKYCWLLAKTAEAIGTDPLQR